MEFEVELFAMSCVMEDAETKAQINISEGLIEALGIDKKAFEEALDSELLIQCANHVMLTLKKLAKEE